MSDKIFNILVVDDLPDVRTTIAGLLTDNGYEVYTAKDEGGAFKILKGSNIDFAVIDICLNEATDDESGLKLANAIYSLAPHIQTAIISGTAKPSHIISAFKDFGVVDYIIKLPGWENRLFQTIKISLREHLGGGKEKSLFISYSHKNKSWLEKFTPNLKLLENKNLLTVWDDTDIKSGQKWNNEIKKALSNAKAALLLVTPDFLASDFIMNVELPELIKASEERDLKILWVAVIPSLYEETAIADFQSTNNPAKPLANLSPAKAQREIVEICKKVLDALN